MGYSPDGDLLWTQIYAGPEPDQSDYLQAIAVDEDANVFVTGNSWGPGTSNNFTTIMYSNSVIFADDCKSSDTLAWTVTVP